MSDVIDFLSEKDFDKKQDFIDKYNGKPIKFVNNPSVVFTQEGEEIKSLIPNRKRGLYVLNILQEFNKEGKVVNIEGYEKEKQRIFENKKQRCLQENENKAETQTQGTTTSLGISLKTEEKISLFGKVVVNIVASFLEKDENFKKILQGMKNIKYCNEDNEVIELTPEQQLQTIKELVEKDDAIWNERYIEHIKKIEECKSAEELDKLKINYE